MLNYGFKLFFKYNLNLKRLNKYLKHKIQNDENTSCDDNWPTIRRYKYDVTIEDVSAEFDFREARMALPLYF